MKRLARMPQEAREGSPTGQKSPTSSTAIHGQRAASGEIDGLAHRPRFRARGAPCRATEFSTIGRACSPV